MTLTRRMLLGLVLVDVPVLAAVAVAGSLYGFVHTYEAVSAWRIAHPWSFAPSVLLAALLAVRWRRG